MSPDPANRNLFSSHPLTSAFARRKFSGVEDDMTQTATAPATTVIISETGEQHGKGTDRYKWVSGLTAHERAAVRSGSALVIVTGSPVCREAPGVLQTVRRVLYRSQGGGPQ